MFAPTSTKHLGVKSMLSNWRRDVAEDRATKSLNFFVGYRPSASSSAPAFAACARDAGLGAATSPRPLLRPVPSLTPQSWPPPVPQTPARGARGRSARRRGGGATRLRTIHAAPRGGGAARLQTSMWHARHRRDLSADDPGVHGPRAVTGGRPRRHGGVTPSPRISRAGAVPTSPPATRARLAAPLIE